MKFGWKLIVVASLTVLTAACAQNVVEEDFFKIKGPKYRIAVVEFRDEFSGVSTTASGTGNAGQDIVNSYVNLLNKAVTQAGDKGGIKTVGAGASKMLETALVKSSNFDVFTRQEMDKVLKEQALGQTGMVTPQSAAKVGQMIGVNAIVIGTVTEFGEKKSNTNVSGNTIRALSGDRANKNLGLALLSAGGFGFSKAEARVVIDVQLIDTTTGRIILADSSEGIESSMGMSIAGISGGSSIDDTKVGKALRKSIHKLVNAISKQMATVPWSARIVKATGRDIIINAGMNSNIQPGSTFDVYKKGEELKDPSTGESLGFEETLAGEAMATQVMERVTKAAVRSGTGFKTGDIVRLKAEPVPPAGAPGPQGQAANAVPVTSK
jgi:curli biogenesis system outer membrane secretion channel CsgG